MQDIRYAIRSLWRSKAFAFVTILCLALGIGLHATIFSVVDGVLLKPYPYEDPDRLLVVETRRRDGGGAGLSAPDLRDWKDGSSLLTTIAASQSRSITIADEGSGEPERYQGAAVTWDLFPLLGTAPLIGRAFTEADDRPGAPAVVLISHVVWTTRYLSDPDILGRTVLIEGSPHTVVGVMPAGFAYPENQRVWIPLGPLVAEAPRDARNLLALGRLRPGATPEQARQELDAVATRLAALYPATNDGWTARFATLRERFLPEYVPLAAALMMGGVTLVLLIACSNVANLLLARARGRLREIAVRAALGAGRGRIVRQLLTESAVIGLLSVPPGLLFAEIGTRVIASGLPVDQVPDYVTWDVDGRVVAYAVALALLTSVVFGLFPALQVSRGTLHATLQSGARGNTTSRSWLRSSLVVAQVSLALVALVGALLFVRSYANLNGGTPGFETASLMTARFMMTGERYEEADARLRRVTDVVERLEALPGVEAAFASNFLPLGGGGGGGAVTIDGRPEEAEGGIAFIGVTPHAARVIGLTLLRGRDFTEAEGRSRAPVAVINEAMAARYWPATDAVGGRFRLARQDEAEWFTVIGVTHSVNLYGEPDGNQLPAAAFVPYAYQQTPNTGLTVRVAGGPASGSPARIMPEVRAALRASDPLLPLFFPRTADELKQLRYWEERILGGIFATIGVMGVLLATIGVYGVLSYSVSQRTAEIGVRVALGAGRRDVFRLVVGEGLRLAGAGILIGLAAAPLATRFARSLLYGVGPFDPLTFGIVALLLVAVAALASYGPARRAVAVDPLVALRAD